ncbi:MAG: ATP synthase F1 subunit gamma [Candidatus Poribacteria bacterium]
MPSIKDLRKRISSVKNTQQTTKAMKMVSAAKLRRSQDAIQNHRPYARRIDSLIRRVSALSSGAIALSPLIRNDEVSPFDRRKKVLLVLVTSDRGLCGAFNSNIIKAAQKWLIANGPAYESVEMSFLGRRGYDFFKTKHVKIASYYQDLGGRVTFVKARKLTAKLIDDYLLGGIDEIKFVYNEFKNVMSQKVVIERFLPLEEEPIENVNTSEEKPVFLIKPSQQQLLDLLIEKNFAVQAFRIMLESQAGEHGARMASMENATRNAGEMIKKLTLQYNKQRQAGITKELLEIIGGTESQKAS